jgi:hypothetical protein
MKPNQVVELAEHCLRYVTPVCEMNFQLRLDVLSEMHKLIQIELNQASAMDPMRNR